jgi:hypothetical protein
VKKLFIILIMLVYGVSSSGMSITLHYCCNKLDSVSFTAHSKSCEMGDRSKKSSCCSDKQISTKAIADQEAAKWVQSLNSTVAVPVSTPAFINFASCKVSVQRLARGTPFKISSVPIFIKNSVFRI